MDCGPCDPDHASLLTHHVPVLSKLFVPVASLLDHEGFVQALPDEEPPELLPDEDPPELLPDDEPLELPPEDDPLELLPDDELLELTPDDEPEPPEPPPDDEPPESEPPSASPCEPVFSEVEFVHPVANAVSATAR